MFYTEQDKNKTCKKCLKQYVRLPSKSLFVLHVIEIGILTQI